MSNWLPLTKVFTIWDRQFHQIALSGHSEHSRKFFPTLSVFQYAAYLRQCGILNASMHHLSSLLDQPPRVFCLWRSNMRSSRIDIKQHQKMILVQFFVCFLSLGITPSWTFAPSFISTASGRYSDQSRFGRRKGVVRYEPNADQPEISYSDSSGVWSALAATEKWIVQTLTSSGGVAGSNPYTRKEVSYVCEIARESPMVVASLFRRVREARELGESHAEDERAHNMDKGTFTDGCVL